jgi:hypothetical protein
MQLENRKTGTASATPKRPKQPQPIVLFQSISKLNLIQDCYPKREGMCATWRTIMLHGLKVAAMTCFAALVLMSEAQAGIPIPCTGDKIVKVADFPQKMATPDGKKIDLGYMFQGCFTGKWIGYVGSSSSYLNLPEELLLTVAAGPDNRSMPKVPGFWASARTNKWQFFAEWLWLGILSIIAGGLISNKIFHGTFAHPSSYPQVAPAAPTPTSVPLRGFGRSAANQQTIRPAPR